MRFHVTPVSAPILVLGLLAGTATATAADMRVAVAPLESMSSGSAASSTAGSKVEAMLESALGMVPGATVVPGHEVRRALEADSKLLVCDGESTCLARLGKAVGATHVVHGEIGGLGDVEVLYLTVIEVGQGRELRSTTAVIGSTEADKSARAAAFQLLAPERYTGTLRLAIDIEGASIYIDGQRLGTSPRPPLALPVGTHAVRITHPEFHDFVRFVDIVFAEELELQVPLQEFPIVASNLAHTPRTPRSNVVYRGVEPLPWYRSWYAVAGVSTAVFLTSALIAGLVAGGIDADSERVVLPVD